MDLYRRCQKWQTRPSNHLFFMGMRTLVKADLGVKRGCPSCGARFYDLTKRPIECPKCGFSFEPEALYKQRRGRQPEPVASVVPAAETEDEEADDENEDAETEEEEAEVVEQAPLNVAATGEDEDEATEEEEAEADSGMSVVEGDEDVAIEDIEVEDEDEDEEGDDSLLAEVEEDEDDVAGIIDPGIAKDEG